VTCNGSAVTFFAGPLNTPALVQVVQGNQGPNGQPYVPNQAKPLYIGMGAPEQFETPQNRNPLFLFKGRLQEFKVFDAALTTEQVLQFGTDEFFGS
jgi:hypothetical protein